MKSIQLFATASLGCFFLLCSCEQGATDNKNEAEPYPNRDTHQHMENMNTPINDSIRAQDSMP